MPERVNISMAEISSLLEGGESAEQARAAVQARFNARGLELGVRITTHDWAECERGHLTTWPKGEEQPLCQECRRALRLERLQRIEETLAAARVPKRFRAASFESFKAETAEARGKLAAARAVAAGTRWGFLFGRCGSGKTHLGAAILREKALAGVEVRFETAAGILLDLKASYRDGVEASELATVKRLRACPVLLIDDLGAEQSTDWARATLLHIIDRRYGDERQTIITSNLSAPEIERRIDMRLADRLSEALVIHMDLPSWRRRRA